MDFNKNSENLHYINTESVTHQLILGGHTAYKKDSLIAFFPYATRVYKRYLLKVFIFSETLQWDFLDLKALLSVINRQIQEK